TRYWALTPHDNRNGADRHWLFPLYYVFGAHRHNQVRMPLHRDNWWQAYQIALQSAGIIPHYHGDIAGAQARIVRRNSALSQRYRDRHKYRIPYLKSPSHIAHSLDRNLRARRGVWHPDAHLWYLNN